METITITSRDERISDTTFFGVFDVPETASTYRLLVFRNPHNHDVCIALLNWGRSAEFGSLPTEEGMAHSIAEHLTDGNLVDARNLILIFRGLASYWKG